MKINLITLTFLLVAVLACPVMAGFNEIPVSSYDFTPDTPAGVGWAADADRTKLIDDVIPAADELWDADKSTCWNWPGNHDDGPTVIFDLGQSQSIDLISVTEFGGSYGYRTVEISTSNEPNVLTREYEAVGTFDSVSRTTTGNQEKVTESIFLNAQGRYVKMYFVNDDYAYAANWVMLAEVEFFQADPNMIIISQNPQDVYEIEGGDVELSVAAWGKTLPLSYQWKMNGVDIEGETSGTLQIVGVTVDDAGAYSCVVTSPANAGGEESAAAIVEVLVAPPLSNYGKRVIGHNPEVYWSFDEVDGAAVEMSSLLGNRVVTADNPIRFEHGELGNAISVLEFENVFGTTTLDSVVTGGPFAIEFWLRLSDPSVTNRYIMEIGIPGGIGNQPGVIYGYNTEELEFFAGTRTQGFTYDDPNDWTEWHHIVLVDYDDEVEAYDNGALVQGFDYRGDPGDYPLNLSQEIGIGSVRKTHEASPDSVIEGDIDEVAIYDFGGMSKEAIRGRVQAIALHGDLDGPAYVTENPLDTIAPPSTDAILTASAAGAEPITYQWKKDGVDIDGATSPTLVLTEVQPGVDDGSYICAVSNAEGGEESAAAVLTVACYYDIPGDLNSDCVVDMEDLAALAAHWLEDSSVQP